MVAHLAAPLHQPDPPHYRPLGQRLRAGRQALPGLSVALLAAALGVTPATIYQYEAGRHRPRRTTLIHLAAVLDIDADELTALAGYPPRPGAPNEAATQQRPPR